MHISFFLWATATFAFKVLWLTLIYHYLHFFKYIYIYSLFIVTNHQQVQVWDSSVSLSSLSLRQRWWPPRSRWTWPSYRWSSGTTAPTTSWNSWSVSGTTGQTSWPASTRDTTGTTASTRSKSTPIHASWFYGGPKVKNLNTSVSLIKVHTLFNTLKLI